MSIRNFDFFEVFMKKIWISLISALYCGFTLGYMHFADPRTNAGALSTIGLDHPVLFALCIQRLNNSATAAAVWLQMRTS